MLRRITILSCCWVIALGLLSYNSPASAETCSADASLGSQYGPGVVSVTLSCSTETGSAGTSVTGTTPDTSPGCFRENGTPVPCFVDDYWWSSLFQTHCKVFSVPADSESWGDHRDDAGNPVGTLYYCLVYIYDVTKATMKWADTSAGAPASVVNPETIIRSAVSSLGLHPPTTGVGAYVYPGYEEWGLSWWVGAPMWLWVETSDPFQWGTHTISASESGVSVTATVAPSYVSYDPGDGSAPVTCGNAGTVRPWNRNDLMSNHSPSRCEHTYMTTNTLGDPDSRFSVTATVTWKVSWSATNGQNGSFTTETTSTSATSIHIGELRVVRVPNPPR